MEKEVLWTSLETVKVLISLLTPLMVVLIGYLLNRRIKMFEKESQKQNERHKEDQQLKREEIERRYKPHIEFSVDCKFFGPQKGWFIVEFTIVVKNLSLIRHQFNKIDLRVRGIKKDEIPNLWTDHGGRLEFPHKLIQENMVPEEWAYIFTEPGVKQRIRFISRLPEDIRFISAWAKFNYDEYNPHTIERMFEVKVSRLQV